tara:strand:+ start:7 stop:1002 length:996 start_codon:yes stop_codon:yes gene_type:complete
MIKFIGMKKIGLMTSGGDAPGMNACIRSITKYCLNEGIVPIGFHDGFQGIIENNYQVLSFKDVNNIVQRGGTILGTYRCEKFKSKEGRRKAIENIESIGLDALICIGGDGTFTGASILSEEMNIPVVGIPGTIDNDIFGTDHTIGYDTALNTVVEAVDKIRDTAGSHNRIFFVEVMGRNAGFIALNSAIASGAESVLIPEEHTDAELLAKDLKEQNKGRRSSIVIVAEGDDGGGAKKIMNQLKPLMNGYSLRYSILGHIQRGGRPSAFDRMLATRMGAFAVELLLKGESNIMIGSNGDRLIHLPITDAIKIIAKPDLTKLDMLTKLRTLNS